jgi:hypothetical protein
MTDTNKDEYATEVFENDDFVFTKKDGHFMGGGYKLNSIFLQQNISPITTFNDPDDMQNGGEQVSSKFENLAVPAGLFYINQKTLKQKNDPYYTTHNTISDDIFDKLFGLVDADKKKKRKTRRIHEKVSKGKKQTRRK